MPGKAAGKRAGTGIVNHGRRPAVVTGKEISRALENHSIT